MHLWAKEGIAHPLAPKGEGTNIYLCAGVDLEGNKKSFFTAKKIFEEVFTGTCELNSNFVILKKVAH